MTTTQTAVELARSLAAIAKHIDAMSPKQRAAFDRACRLYDVEPPRLRRQPEANGETR